jgi:hypothetical protein
MFEMLAAQSHGLLFWLGLFAIVAGVVVMVMGRLAVGIVLVVLGFLLAFGGFSIRAG